MSLIELILNCPFPSYPKVHVLRIPGNNLLLKFKSLIFFTEA